jgi:iron complex outermembrane recepter protein
MKTVNAFLYTASLLAMCALSTEVAAQEAQATDESVTGLGEIVVTAQRRQESSQKAAVPIAVILPEAIDKAQVSQPTQLTNLVPTLQVGTVGASSTTFFIRGVGTLSLNPYTDPGVAFNLDGVYIGRTSATSGHFYDLARVEVLKGPQGTLYGRNATGGAINVIPAAPVLGESSVDASFSAGNYAAFGAQAAINLPIGQNAAFRIAGNYATHDGYLSDGSSDLDAKGFRAQLLFAPSDDIKVRLSGDYFERSGKGAGGSINAVSFTNPFTNTTAIVPSGLSLGTGSLDPATGAVLSGVFNGLMGRFMAPFTTPNSIDGKYWGVHAQVDVKTPVGQLTLIPAYRHFENDDVSISGLSLRDRSNGDQASFEARLSNTIGKVEYLLGAFYFDEDYSSNYIVNTQAISGEQQFQAASRSWAGFGRLTYHATDRLRLVGGLRYTHDSKRFIADGRAFLNICNSLAGCFGAPILPFPATTEQIIAGMGLVQVAPGVYVQPANPGAADTLFVRSDTSYDKRLSTGKTTFRGAVEFDVGPQSLLYASFESGFRSGGFSFAKGPNTYAPEAIDAWTIGSKNRFFDNRLQLNVEAFLWKYKDQQVSHVSNDIDGTPVFITENIGRSTNKGIEVSLEGKPLPDTLVGLDVQYLDAKYDSFVYRVPGTANPILSTPGNTVYFPQPSGCAVSAPAGGIFTVNCNGRRPPYAPVWTLSGRLQQTIRLGDSRLILSASTRYQTDAYVGFDQLPSDLQKGYWRSNADITFSLPRDWASLTLFVNNIENNRQLLYTQYNAAASNSLATASDPRTYGLRVAVHF